MRITQTHLTFFVRRKHPTLAAMIRKTLQPSVTIHECINAHANLRAEYLSASNLVNLVLMARKRGESDLANYLHQLSRNPGTIINPQRRAAFAKKWSARITQERIRRYLNENIR